ncbi:MAG TPA: hypothetical protein VGB95_00895 [Chitinophagales bacterium]
MNRIRRYYYPIGLVISLFLLLAFYIWCPHNKYSKYRAIEVVWWGPNLHKDFPNDFPVENHPNINYIDISILGNDSIDKVKLDYAQLQIRELIKSEDTLTGIHFYFNGTARYWTFVRAIDILNEERTKVYIPYGNDIWVLNSQTAKHWLQKYRDSL